MGRRPSNSRDPVAILSLTAMVDMFSVLAIFLLQSYASTGQPLDLPENIDLPKSIHVRKANPAHVVVLAKDKLYLDKELVGSVQSITEDPKWMIPSLYDSVKDLIIKDEQLAEESPSSSIPHVSSEDVENPIPYHKRYTIQADKDTSFFAIKKVLYTLTEAGIIEINFTVIYEKGVQDI